MPGAACRASASARATDSPRARARAASRAASVARIWASPTVTSQTIASVTATSSGSTTGRLGGDRAPLVTAHPMPSIPSTCWNIWRSIASPNPPVTSW